MTMEGVCHYPQLVHINSLYSFFSIFLAFSRFLSLISSGVGGGCSPQLSHLSISFFLRQALFFSSLSFRTCSMSTSSCSGVGNSKAPSKKVLKGKTIQNEYNKTMTISYLALGWPVITSLLSFLSPLRSNRFA